MKKIILLVLISIISQSILGQSQKDFIIEKFNHYFKTTRENVFIHTNKNVYFSNETIWFKGYILDKKSEKLNYETTNVYVTLYNEENEEIETFLFFAKDGVVLGQIKLNKNLETGKYHIYCYTNFMNNFIEDESIVNNLLILNSNEHNKINIEDSNKYFFDIEYEGGNFLHNIDNNISVRLINCKGNGLINKKIEVLDSNDNLVGSFITNDLGYGKFKLIKTSNQIYKLKIDENIEYLKSPEIEGITLEVNNYSLEDKVLITVKTNSFTLEKIKNNPFLLTINKNDLVSFIDLKFDNKNTIELLLSKEIFYRGINTLRLLDEKSNLISERVFYNHIEDSKLKVSSIIKNKDSLRFKGTINTKIANLSISITPTSNLNLNKDSNIISSLEFNNYLNKPVELPNGYFKKFDRRKKYDLDLQLLGKKSKYNLQNILNEKPTSNYSFDLGLEIEGKINETNNVRKSEIQLFSANGINEFTTINEDNSFNFKNLIIIDSSTCYFSLVKNREKHQTFSVYSKVKNAKVNYLKKPKFKKNICQSVIVSDEKLTDESSFYFPEINNNYVLDTISLVGKKKEKLQNVSFRSNNAMARGYKITDDEYNSFRDVLTFIASHGYDVNYEAGNVVIRNRVATSINGSRTPAVFIDNSPVYDLNQLYNLYLNEIDEIYINKHGYGMGDGGTNGVINIYRKKTLGPSEGSIKIKSKSLTIKNGFQRLQTFKNLNYINYYSESFQNFGVIDWINNLYTDENGNFSFDFPHYYQDELKVNIQGIDNYGQLYNETILLTRDNTNNYIIKQLN